MNKKTIDSIPETHPFLLIAEYCCETEMQVVVLLKTSPFPQQLNIYVSICIIPEVQTSTDLQNHVLF